MFGGSYCQTTIMSRPFLFFIFFLFIACKENNNINLHHNNFADPEIIVETIKAVPVPAGYERMIPTKDSFGEWQRAIRLKKDKHVYLYDGTLKKNQAVQFAVPDIPVGKNDL